MKLYSDLASWWPLVSAPADYQEEAALFAKALLGAADGPVRSLLELGSGGGNNASFLKADFDLTLVDPAAGMLDVSRRLNPECVHVQGDMRTIRLGRTFDAVFIHDAIVYMTTEADLKAAMSTAYVHCRPGGVALMAPDFVKETFKASTECGGHDEDDRSFRYLEWTWDPDPNDNTYAVDYVLVTRNGVQMPQTTTERHIEGLFGQDQWLAWMRETGFAPRVVPIEHSELEPGSYQAFVGVRES